MRVTVRLFARLRDLAGTAEMSREIQPGGTIGAVWRDLAGEFPALADYERSISAALNAPTWASVRLMMVVVLSPSTWTGNSRAT